MKNTAYFAAIKAGLVTVQVLRDAKTGEIFYGHCREHATSELALSHVAAGSALVTHRLLPRTLVGVKVGSIAI